jgi:hypothetical protein
MHACASTAIPQAPKLQAPGRHWEQLDHFGASQQRSAGLRVQTRSARRSKLESLHQEEARVCVHAITLVQRPPSNLDDRVLWDPPSHGEDGRVWSTDPQQGALRSSGST